MIHASNAAAWVALGATLAAALVGLIFRGAAAAWREEARAATDKADRLEGRIAEQQVTIDQLTVEVNRLTRLTNVEQLAERATREHGEIVLALQALEKAVHAQTVAVEFMARHIFPTELARTSQM